jgi:hypothetical protein
MEEDVLRQLKKYMANLPAGPIAPERGQELIQHLMKCWHVFSGSDEEAMEDYKLLRMEDPSWDPPVLSFIIERHGWTAMGSTRAELQRWGVDLDRKVADWVKDGYRQIEKRDSAFNVKPIADELSKLIQEGRQDERLQWAASGRVRVLFGKIIPTTNKRTTEGRKARLVGALERRMIPIGWHRRGSWWGKI